MFKPILHLIFKLNVMLVTNLIKKSLIPLVLFLSFGFSSFAQNAISSTGGYFKTIGGSTSFTVGQFAYVLKKGTGPYLNEGVQQVYTKKTTPIEELVYLKEVQLYPNPTQETMTLILSSKEDVQVRYTIMYYLGKEIRTGNILSEKSEISLRDLPSGNYFISLKSKKENRIFKMVII